MRIQIVATGFYAPPKVETAEELGPKIGREPEWIKTRAGVAKRHIAEEPVERMAAQAVLRAMAGNGPPDLLLSAALTPRQAVPDTSVFIARELGWNGVPAYSIHATCLSFVVALRHAAAMITTGAHRRVAIVSAEVASLGRDYEQPESCALLGDGAGAAIVESTPTSKKSRLLAWVMRTYPEGAELTQIPGAGQHRHPARPGANPKDLMFTMNGPAVYKLARTHLGSLLDEAYTRAGLRGPQDIDLVIPHQASALGLASLRRLGLPEERVVNILADYGNCIAASMPMALAHAHQAGRISRGDRVLLLGTGAGLSMAAAILIW